MFRARGGLRPVTVSFFFISSLISAQLLLEEKNVQIDEAAMTDTLRGNNLLMPSRASNPNMRIKRESSTEKIHKNYGIGLSINSP